MINMSHYRDDRCAGYQGSIIRRLVCGEQGLGVLELSGGRFMTHLLDDQNRCVLVKHLVDGHHRAHFH